ncbi:hypothetical protein Pan1_64 [Pseudanabaena phage Pan1]|nr:hypothetical protein Pan1_64 [Pseudanabaena phage Pan1]
MTDDFDETTLDETPHFLFEVSVGDEPRARVFGPQEKRNWVFWKLSQYAIALEDEGIVSVKRYTNGEWRPCNDWRNLAH